MRPYRVRLATKKDISTLAEQRHRMFMDMHSPAKKEMDVHDKAFPEWARREMRAKRLISFLVETEDGKVVGGGSLWLREVQPYPGFKGGKTPYLMSVYTEPGHRGKGVATMILRRAIAWSKLRGYPSISLHASKMGRPLYEKFGWKQSSEMTLDF
jgi:GNAT superfamily N-acetyltransferase